MTAFRHVAVIGAGTMGHGIAYVAALAGHQVRLADADAATLERGLQRIRTSFDTAIAKGKCTPHQRDAALGALTTCGAAIDAARDADLVIEAVPEKLELKKRLFAELEPVVAPNAVLASNTSSLSITAIASALTHQDRVIGMHFFNPVPVMKLLELVRGERTSDDVVERARAFAERIGKTPIIVRDTPGFATSRLGVVLGLEAIRMLEQGVASAEDIDRAMELGYNHPMGPLRLTDLVGLDVRLAIAEHLHATFGDDTYRPPELLRRLVAEGRLGKKSGHGFYRWETST
ncbi:MAG TPA: 3-hydroxyacyl-CoA dehydrogenase family protein [Gemmatimonadaceae bacterium]|nr:3-hydroxyacyl-CoA dehydrogenase family protein [Gemmatimonadaceae bacterium]